MAAVSKNSRLVLLISSLLIVVPMVIFRPNSGIDLSTGFSTYAMFEVIFYGVVLFIFRPSTTLLKLLQGAGLTFLYRIVLGTIFGALISVTYGIGFSVSLTLGISRYLPAILLQALAAPFAMKPYYLAMLGEDVRERRHYPRSASAVSQGKEETTRQYISRAEMKPGVITERRQAEPKAEMVLGHDINGFERAVRYLGEHHAVMIAAVVDMEGLTLASFKRGNIEPDDWIPLSMLFQRSNESILRRNKEGNSPDRLDLSFGSCKLVIVKISNFNLLILSHREEDELLGVRITQAADIIRKYSSERYGNMVPTSPEEKYVSNT